MSTLSCLAQKDAANVGAMIHMYDRIGCEVYTEAIDGAAKNIPTEGLESGYYYVTVHATDGSQVYSGGATVLH